MNVTFRERGHLYAQVGTELAIFALTILQLVLVTKNLANDNSNSGQKNELTED